MKRTIAVLTITTLLLLAWLYDRKLRRRMAEIAKADQGGIEAGRDLDEFLEEIDDE